MPLDYKVHLEPQAQVQQEQLDQQEPQEMTEPPVQPVYKDQLVPQVLDPPVPQV